MAILRIKVSKSVQRISGHIDLDEFSQCQKIPKSLVLNGLVFTKEGVGEKNLKIFFAALGEKLLLIITKQGKCFLDVEFV